MVPEEEGGIPEEYRNFKAPDTSDPANPPDSESTESEPPPIADDGGQSPETPKPNGDQSTNQTEAGPGDGPEQRNRVEFELNKHYAKELQDSLTYLIRLLDHRDGEELDPLFATLKILLANPEQT